MITAYNTVYKDRYTNLFQEAMDVLIEKGIIDDIIEEPVLDAEGKPVVDENGEAVVDKKPANDYDYITSLEKYFTYMGDLTGIYNDSISSAKINEDYAKYSRFLMLPLDEEYFEINANARTITVPNEYKRYGVSVTEDVVAETLLFRIDRYFDFVDLMTKKIWVQWKNPEGQEGASRVALIDHETEPGKIIFGWPLTDKVVGKTKGKIEFAITFFSKEGTTINYSFNTLPVEVEIKQGMEITPIAEEDVEQPYFDFVVNSNSAFSPDPSVPEFVDGVFLTEANYGEEGKAVLRAQATITDTGKLNYKWFYYPSYIQENEPIESNQSYNVSKYVKDIYEETQDLTVNKEKTYYIEKFEANSENVGYTVLDKKTYPETFPEDVKVYERFSELTIPITLGEEEDLQHLTEGTGKYYVEASNRFGTNTKTSESPICVVPMPKEIEYTTDLPQAVTLQGEEEIKTANLEFEAKEVDYDDSDFISYAYSWEFTSPEAETASPLENTTKSIEVSEVGWYQAKTIATLNGQSLYKLSNKCKVVAPTRAPQLEKVNPNMLNGNWYLENNNLKAEILIEKLKPEFETDNIEVRWYKVVQDPDYNTIVDDIWLNNPELSEEEQKALAPEIKAMILEDSIVDETKLSAYLELEYIPEKEVYYVQVVNTLNGQTAIAELLNENNERINIIAISL